MKIASLLFISLLASICFTAEIVLSEKNVVQVPPVISADEIINKMFQAADNIKTLKYIFISAERIEGKLLTRKSSVKLQTSPKKLYFDCKDAEVLWSGENKNDAALVHPHGFPYFNINLEPNS